MKALFLTNIPAPYREQVHENCNKLFNEQYKVIYCSRIESNRSWKIKFGEYDKTFLDSKSVTFRQRAIYLSSNITSVLKKEKADVIIIGGFSLPMIIAYFWALFSNVKVISFSDATVESERNLSWFHKCVRSFFYKYSDGFIGASKKTLELFKYYGANDQELFQSHLCANNKAFSSCRKFEEREYDILLCGQMTPRKMFDFSLDVIECLSNTGLKLKIKLMGDGPELKNILCRLNSLNVQFQYEGFVEQRELPRHYADCKIFLFPSKKDPWGVVANEACAAGTPVFTSPLVGAANELILNGENGYVELPDVSVWAEKVQHLLSNSQIWQRYSDRAIDLVQEYNYENASKGIYEAALYVRDKK